MSYSNPVTVENDDADENDDIPLLARVPERDHGLSAWDLLGVGLGFNGSKGPQTLGVDAHSGGRAEIYTALPLVDSMSIGLQVGTSVNYERSAVKVLDTINGTEDRWQIFNTAGLFQRTEFGTTAGIAVDWLYQDYFDSAHAAQLRVLAGWLFTEHDELGWWMTIPLTNSTVDLAGQQFRLRGLLQYYGYWQHHWNSGALTRVWLGIVPEHSEFVLIQRGDNPARGQIAYGAEIFVPLSKNWALWGEGNFIAPTNTGTVDAALGLAFFPGGRARVARRDWYSPVFRVANNATFTLNVER